MLGFTFGFKGIYPLLPILFTMTQDPELRNPNIVSRRTARHKVTYSNLNCYLSIEFDWFESGVLAVCTGVSAIDPAASGGTPYFDHGNVRVFKSAAAKRLTSIANSLAEGIDMAYFPDPSHFTPPPLDFLDPTDAHYNYSIHEAKDPARHSSTPSSYDLNHQCEQTFDIEKESSMRPYQGSTTQWRAGSTCLDRGGVNSAATTHTTALWNKFRKSIAFPRRTGVYITTLSEKMEGRFGKEKQIYGRESHYNFLSTSSVNMHGRIQRLCMQLGIETSSPLEDATLMKNVRYKDMLCIHDTEGRNQTDIRNDMGITDSLAGDVIYQEYGKMSNVNSVNNKDEKGIGTSSQSGVVEGRGLIAPPRSFSNICNSQGGNTPGNNRHCLNSIQGNNMFLDIQSRQISKRKSSEVVRKLVNPLQRPQLEANQKQKSYYSPSIFSGRIESFSILNKVRPRDSKNRLYGSLEPVDGDDARGSQLKEEIEKGPGSAPVGDKKCIVSSSKGGGRVWICGQCGLKIRGKRGNLNRHIANKHENIRAYSCNVEKCGRKFQTRLNLVRHETAVHLGRPFTCSRCPRTFKYGKDLASHVKSAHENPEVKLACEICGGCFGRRSTLNRHIANVHKEKTNCFITSAK